MPHLFQWEKLNFLIDAFASLFKHKKLPPFDHYF
ncbi:hypothetical protein AGROH133_09960 [Agrobacterium tumefaciens]|nr:hypothetical protein AGROH133_09347 [Agrobacterium tumefaciens]ADY66022.1 hypothetical protein AGROH133_09960 [Agrobacterium tumefaciens]